MNRSAGSGSRSNGGRWYGKLAFGLALAVLTLAVWRSTSLRGLPDIGDPFDVQELFAFQIPEDENAWTFYKRASEQLTPEPLVDAPSQVAPEQNPGVLKWLEESKNVLALWIEGSKRDRAIYTPYRDLSFETLLPAVQNLRSMARLGLYEGALRESKGDFAGAWEIYRAGIRSSRHSGMNGTLIERLVGCAIHSMFAARITAWAQNPRVDASLLKRALSDVEAAELLTPKPSVQLKTEYISCMRALNEGLEKLLEPMDPSHPKSGAGEDLARSYFFGVQRFFAREPERSRRVMRLVFANWLAAADLTPAERAKRFVEVGNIVLFRAKAEGDPASQPLSAEELFPWIESSTVAKMLLPSMTAADRAIARDRATAAALLVHLAEQAAFRETGKFPESPESLIGAYLKAVPDGYLPIVGPPDALANRPRVSAQPTSQPPAKP